MYHDLIRYTTDVLFFKSEKSLVLQRGALMTPDETRGEKNKRPARKISKKANILQ